jgi:hypothetical protein
MGCVSTMLMTKSYLSVTTILKATESEDKKESLARWKDRVGEVEADRIKNTAALRGTAMHTYLEHYIKGGNVLDLTDVGREASGMGQVIIDKGFLTWRKYGASSVRYITQGYMQGKPICVEFIKDAKV